MSENFQSPSELRAKIKKVTKGVKNSEFQVGSRYEKEREGWVAERLGSALESTGLRVSICLTMEQNSETDFMLEVENQVLRFQLTLVEERERKRGNEYKQREKEPLLKRKYEPQRGMQEGPSWIAAAVRAKHEKKYASPPHLIAYVNFYADSLDVAEILRLCDEYRSSFPSFWVLQNHRVIQVWDCDQTKGWMRDWINL